MCEVQLRGWVWKYNLAAWDYPESKSVWIKESSQGLALRLSLVKEQGNEEKPVQMAEKGEISDLGGDSGNCGLVEDKWSLDRIDHCL